MIFLRKLLIGRAMLVTMGIASNGARLWRILSQQQGVACARLRKASKDYTFVRNAFFSLVRWQPHVSAGRFLYTDLQWSHDMTSAKPLLSFLLDSDFRDKYPHQLVMRYPHVAERIELLWNDADAVANYFSELMIPVRPNRKGFPSEVAAEIMSLGAAFDRIGPLLVSEDRSKPNTSTAYLWDIEALVEDKEGRAFPFTREGFAKAAEQGNCEICSKFIEAGIDVDTLVLRDWTPLMIAAFYGREPLALMLLERGANRFAKDLDGYTPLHWAAFSGYREVVRLLLERGVPSNVLSNAGNSPLLQASARGHLGVISLLLYHQANPNLKASDGSTALVKAVANNHFEVALALVNSGAHRNVTLKDGTTLEDIVAKAKDSRMRAIFA